MTNLIEELKEIFELANNVTSFIEEVKCAVKKEKSGDNKDDNGDYSKLAASGDLSQLAASGDYSQLAASGDSSKLAASGDSSKLAASGDLSKLAASGDSSKLAASGDLSKLAASGDYSQLAASGHFSKLAASGDLSKLASSGEKSVISAIGVYSIARAKIGSWITLAEYKYVGSHYEVDFVKTEYVDGKRIKEDTFYTLCNHEFKEYGKFDGIECAIISHKKDVYKVKNFENEKESYIVEKDGIYSHGDTLKQAKEDLIYKISNRDTSSYEKLTLDSEVTFEEAVKMYRVITGACEVGTKHFVSMLDKIKKKYTIAEIIQLTEGQYGSDNFKRFFEKKE